jgi:PleD family two-component response regulator
MAGSAGTFGFEELGVQARVFESRLKPLLSGTEWSQTELDDYARDIRDYFAAALNNLNKEHAPSDIASPDASETASPDNQSRLIYLVNQDCRQNQEITTQLEHFGYETVSVEQSKNLALAVARRRPDVIVIDMGSAEDGTGGVEEIKK